MNYEKEFFAAINQNRAATFEIVDNCADILLQEVEKQPTQEFRQAKINAIFADIYCCWEACNYKCTDKTDFDRKMILFLLSNFLDRCKNENMYVSKKTAQEYLKNADFYKEFFINHFCCENENLTAMGYISLYGNNAKDTPIFEWQKLDPLPDMPANLYDREDFARAVFYYAEKEHFLIFDKSNNKYVFNSEKYNNKNPALAYMCSCILYYGKIDAPEVTKFPPQEDFSNYFGIDLYKAQLQRVTNFEDKKQQRKSNPEITINAKPQGWEIVNRIVKNAAKDIEQINTAK